MEDKMWKIFCTTGSVQDYLNYKSCVGSGSIGGKADSKGDCDQGRPF